MNRALRHAGWRYLTRHLGATLLMIAGIALGVAVMVAVDIANTSATRAFDLSVDAVAGRATHQVVGGPRGLDESVYARLRTGANLGGAQMAPVVADYLSSPQLGARPLQLLGIDPFAEAPFRSYLAASPVQNAAGPGAASAAGPEPGGAYLSELISFLTRPGALLVSEDLAGQYGLAVGQQIDVDVSGRRGTAFIAGLLRPSDSLSRRALENLVLADISTAQELTGRLGRLDRIDLILPPNDPTAEKAVTALLPPDAQLAPAAGRSGTVDQMSAAFRTNLTALSLLALLVGMFLIYNSMTFSVVQRRPLFGTLRCLGATRGEIGILVLGEAAAAGAIGSALGLALGVLMGQAAVRLVTQTINDLYYVVSVRGIALPVESLVKGAAAGMAATLLAAALPAREAMAVPPRLALSRSLVEDTARRSVSRAAWGGAAALLLGGGVLLVPTRSLFVSFGGLLFVTLGCALLAPAVTLVLLRLASPLTARLWGVLGRMAPRSVATTLSRTAVAVAALMVAVSVTIGVGVMVSSFRGTVITWLGQTLASDIYVSAPNVTSTRPTATIDPRVIQAVENWPRADVQKLRAVTVLSPAGPIALSAVDGRDYATSRHYVSADGSPQAVLAAVKAGAVIVTEPLAVRLGLPGHGGRLALQTDNGPREFAVAGIYRDYSSSQGIALMDAATYHAWWHDADWTALSLTLPPGSDVDRVASALQAQLAPIQGVRVQANATLRAEVLRVFDRAFAITGALQLLAAVVAFIGVLSALLSLQLERAREVGVLRSIGLTGRQLRALVLLETGLMGAAAGLLSMPTGMALSLALIYIINRRSFGWTLDLQAGPAIFAQALLLAMLAAVLAGLYPAARLARMPIPEAVRSE